MTALRHVAIRLAIALVIGMSSIATARAAVHEVSYDSPAVGRRLKYAVLLPDGYAKSGERYPVLYLLHGHTGNYRSWQTYAKLPEDTATRLGALVVFADGGNGFYTNWQGATGDASHRWEDAIVTDLVDAVDARWRTARGARHRAIGGLSMGGYGAVAIALRHPDRFSFALSSAGALGFPARAQEEIRAGAPDWNEPQRWSSDERPPVDIPGFATQRERTPQGLVFATEAQARAVDPYVLAETADAQKLPYLHLDCGLQDGLLPETLRLAEVLRRRKAAHSLVLLPGDHEAPYWSQAFEHTLLVLRAHFARASSRKQGRAVQRRRRNSGSRLRMAHAPAAKQTIRPRKRETPGTRDPAFARADKQESATNAL